MFTNTKSSSLSFWINHIKHLHHRNMDLGLERVKYVAKKLKLLHPSPYTIIVGGTNGKGTTCHLLERILISSGIRVGVYNSPHILYYNERIRIQGKILQDTDLVQSMKIIEKHRHNISLSYFEFSTLSALQLFKKFSVDVAILEVGLGGKLDATNIINSDISVITNIALDHTEILGTNRNSIAKQKSGIFRNKKPAIFGEENVPKALFNEANKIGALLYVKNKNWWIKIKKNKKKWSWWNKNYILTALPIPKIPIENAATALAIVSCLPFNISKKNIKNELQKIQLPGRFQCIKKNPLIILDAAHNPHASAYLSNNIKKILKKTKKITVIVGMLKDKNIQGTLANFKGIAKNWNCASIKHERGATSEELSIHLRGENIKQFNNVVSAWNQTIKDSSKTDCILIFGSFHTISPIMKLLRISTYPKI
ncbi:MAG: bifunctional folylpolyglutamate synthetase/dihydrofolate synthetase [Candidatus Westeberhardia cardiocondylae]|nr:bifunctional folylpolyglutamate synthetase/dihydrofolate synthetase [Candidatus Westeberhardia cardiocondylae]